MSHPTLKPADYFSLHGKVAVITGGAAGIGYAIAKCFIAQGAKVVLLDRAEGVQQAATDLGEGTYAITLDVTHKAEVERAAAEVKKRFERIDIVVNSAGIAILEPAADVTEQAWDKTLNVNLKGTFLVSQVFGKYLLAERRGKIINLASQAGVIALENHLAYCVSKAGVIGLTQVLALEWGPYNIQINAISPTVVLTELGRKAWDGPVGEALKSKIPLRRFAETQDIAAAALYLASEASSMVTGTNLLVDGGYTIQ